MSARGDCPSSDTQSDYTGRGSSLASREDLQEVAASLGVPHDLLFVDRFRVDRKRLELLIFGNECAPEAAVEFFDNIMLETNTRVIWPSRLKRGAKSKRDPHIKVIGLVENVEQARKQILSVLDMRSTRVTLKIDVSYTDHSHIIGKAGASIKKVMDESQCHIHFPDSNRNNPTEKSNQVSITGSMHGVELARSRVRELTPLIFCFDLPIVGSMSVTDSGDPFIKELQEKYNVQVMFRSRQKLNSTLLVVKGCEWEVAKVKEATQLLIHHTCDQLASQVQVHMMLEISPQHQNIVLGQNNENLLGIMQRTSTQIIFVDPNDPNIPKLKKSNVTITGSIHNVYLARQQLIGSLPVVLICDVPDNSVVVDFERMEEIMNNYDVFITTRNKFKQNFISFIIKGIERNISNIYEARRELLSLSDESVHVNIPSTYVIPNAGGTFRANYCNASICISSPLIATPAGGNNSNIFDFPWPQLRRPSPQPMAPQTMQLPSQQQAACHPLFPPPHFFHRPHNVQFPQHLYPHLSDQSGHLSHSSLSLPDMPVYSSLGSTTSNLSSPSTSPRAASPITLTMPESTKKKLNGSDGQLNSPGDWRAPGVERKLSKQFDHQQLKIQAIKALQKTASPGELRVSTSHWSGYGFSQSNPYSSLRDQQAKQEDHLTQGDKEWNGREGGWPPEESNTLSSSNYADSVSSSNMSNLITSDLHTLLASVGLEKYMHVFVKNEIDLATFRSLTETDLKDIGISAFGARRKMAFCIAELNRQQNSFYNEKTSSNSDKDPSSFPNW